MLMDWIGIFGNWCKKESWRLIAVLGGSGKKFFPKIAPVSGNFDLKFERFLKHRFLILFLYSTKNSVSTE